MKNYFDMSIHEKIDIRSRMRARTQKCFPLACKMEDFKRRAIVAVKLKYDRSREMNMAGYNAMFS
jgi:hypothetical protein